MRFRRDVEGDLLDREFLVGTTDAEIAIGRFALSDEQEFGIVGTETTDGIAVLCVFTSETRLTEWFPEGSHVLGLKGRDMLALFLRGEWTAIVIDPSQPNRTELFRDDAERLLA